MRSMRFAILLLLLAVAPLWAMQNPQQLVEQTTDEILNTLRAEHEEIELRQAYLYEIVDAIVLPHFDFERMASWVLGKHRRKASPDERQQFAAEFKDLLVRTYAKALNENYNQQIDMLPMRESLDGSEVTVRTEVQQKGGFPIPIDYKMHIKDGSWKVFDVDVDGISLVTNYRTSFSREIRKDGLPKLIQRLAARNQEARAE